MQCGYHICCSVCREATCHESDYNDVLSGMKSLASTRECIARWSNFFIPLHEAAMLSGDLGTK